MIIKQGMYYKGECGKMKSFRIKNIKAFKDSGIIELKPITIFVGKNSCGKSSLLRFPVVLAQTSTSNTESPLMFYGKMIDYGNYEDVVFGRDDNAIEFELNYDIDIHDTQDSRYNMVDVEADIKSNKHDVREVGIKVSISRKERKMHVDFVELCIDGECLSGFYCENDGCRIELNYIYEDYMLKPEKYNIHVEELEFESFFPVYDMRHAFSSIVGLVTNEDGQPVEREKGQEVYNKLYNLANPYDDSDLSEEEKQIKRIKAGLEYVSSIMSHVYSNFGIESRITTYIGPFRENPQRI